MMRARINSEAVTRRFRALPDELQKGVQKSVVRGAEDVADQARALAPGGSELQDSIMVAGPGKKVVRRGKTSETLGPMQALVLVDAWYARFVEFGTKRHVNRGQFAGTTHPGTKARPFFWPAYRLTKKKVARRVKTAIGKALRRDAGI